MHKDQEITLNRLLDFFDIEDENGVSNLDKVHKYQKILRRVETTDRTARSADGFSPDPADRPIR